MKLKKILFLIFMINCFILVGCNTPLHTHEFIDGVCDCGEKNPEYTPPHTHEFIDGVCDCGEKENLAIIHEVIFKDYNGEVIKSVSVLEGEDAPLPEAPVRERYVFVGWSEDVTNITKSMIVYAVYEKEKITVGENSEFKTIEEALEYAEDGDVICVEGGTFDGFVINKSVELRGINYNIDPTSNRITETTITSDIIVNASNVIINGFQLIGKSKVTFDNLKSNVENIEILCCKVSNTTVNENNNRDTAPFNLVSNNNFLIKNVVFDNCYIEKVATGRPMAFYIVDVENITIKNSSFYGCVIKDNYNDAIKVDNKENGNATFGVKGNVTIINNTFKNYAQYPIWFRQYGSGNYIIENNSFENIGQTPGSHAAISFIDSIDCENINISVRNNIINNGYMLFRIDNLECPLENVKCNINENFLVNTKDNCYIKNGVPNFEINAQKNYYGSKVISSDNFVGLVDYSNYYTSVYNGPGFERIELLYDTTPYVEAGKTVKIAYELLGIEEEDIIWKSSNENIAIVNEVGEVTGISKGTVEITAISEKFNIEKTIIFEVLDEIEKMDEVVKFLLSIMNSYSYATTAANSRTNYGFTNPYYYSIYRSATSYLFEDLVIDTESYKRDGEAKLVNNKVEYITIHDTWAMPKTAEGLAQYFQKDITSVHYTIGNDGIFQIIRLTDKGAHAGDSPYRAYALEKTNVIATTEEPEITMIDGYFAINGIKTELRPYLDYEGTIQDPNNYTTSQLTYSGIRCLIGEDGYYYLGKTYFNETYKTVSNFGGNANSIGIEMESQKGTDFFLNMQRTAKTVAMLLDKFGLTTNDVKMHNYFSGKNCAQLLKNNLKYKFDYQIDKHNIKDTLWDEFLQLCDVELKMIEYCKQYKFEFISHNTELLTNTGRVINHNVNSECVKYTIKITNIQTNETFELNSSIIIPSSLDIDECYLRK